jgi:DNA-binding FadR family transcriptional regulator
LLLKRKTLTSQVIDHVLSLIRSGAVKPGDRLPSETELTRTLGVSRTCVREAMKALEARRLVGIRQRTGATVLLPSSANLMNDEHFSLIMQSQAAEELLEFRKIIEVGLASLAADKADEGDLAAMRDALERYRTELAGNHVDCGTDMSFHIALAAASRNGIAVMVWRMLAERMAQVLQRTVTVPHICEETLKDHEKIYHAVKSRDPRKAREAMREHLENAERNWRKAFGRAEPAYCGKASSIKAETPIAMPR